MNLRESHALVTGGGTGIGRAIALELAAAGATVAIVGRREEKLRETASLAGPGPLLPLVGDVSSLADVEAMARRATAEHGPIDILVNAAGSNVRNRSIKSLSPEDWQRLVDVNATGSFHCIHALLPGMIERGRGLIVNISSIAGLRATPLGGVAYNASKFAQSALGITTGMECGPDGVRVTNIYPGETNTPILDERAEPPPEAYRARLLQPADVAAMVLAVARLPDRARVPELVITPTDYPWH